MGAYGDVLARVHDDSFGWVARAAAGELVRMLAERGVTAGLVVDLGCGSGAASRVLVDAGFDVFGVDASAAMLSRAREAVPEAQFVEGSMHAVELPPCVGILAAGEVVCYLAESERGASAPPWSGGVEAGMAHREAHSDGGGGPATTGHGPEADQGWAELRDLFQRAHAALDPLGVLLFDSAGPGRGGPPYREQVWDGPDWTLWVRTDRDDRARRLIRRIVTFARTASGQYIRDDETHVLRLLDPAILAAVLHEAGFVSSGLPGYGARPLGQGWNVWACTPDELAVASSRASTSHREPQWTPSPEASIRVGRAAAWLDVREPRSGERFDVLARWPDVLVEHIVSSDSPDTSVQVQDHDEWVLLMQGDATLVVGEADVSLAAGQWLPIPAGTRHHVRRTSSRAQWLTVHVWPRSRT